MAARFFLVQHTKTGKNLPNNHNLYQIAAKYAQIGQMAIHHNNIFHRKNPPKFTQNVIFGLKIHTYAIWQPWTAQMNFHSESTPILNRVARFFYKPKQGKINKWP
jgi:hypothetical protein